MLVPDELETPAVVVDTCAAGAQPPRMPAAAGSGRRGAADARQDAQVPGDRAAPARARRRRADGGDTRWRRRLFAADGCPSVFSPTRCGRAPGTGPRGAGRAPRANRAAGRRGQRRGGRGSRGRRSRARGCSSRSIPGSPLGTPWAEVAALAVECRALGLDVIGRVHARRARLLRSRKASGIAAALARRAGRARRGRGAALAGPTSTRWPPVLSGGSTPTAETEVAAPLTEVRPGTYVFGDRQQMALTGLPWKTTSPSSSQRALCRPRGRARPCLTAVSKTLSSDRAGWLNGARPEPGGTGGHDRQPQRGARRCPRPHHAAAGRRPRQRHPQPRLPGGQPGQRTCSSRTGTRSPAAGRLPPAAKPRGTRLSCVV